VKFDEPLDNTDRDLVVQYELRLQKDLDCGGAYIKLLTASSLPSDLTKFSNEVPYTIMFGPDKCGNTNKVHFIVRQKNPVNGEYEEKHLKNAPAIKSDTITHLYKLHLRKDNSFTISIDNSVAREGNLLEDFEPPFNPPKEIDDPSDKKPADWVDEAKIPDPAATKPEDWDESAPATIIDQHDSKPENWLDDAPLTVPDPETSKPEDWDDDLDGEWEAPQIPNPDCIAIGCGTWKPRSIANPEYKGKWSPPLIDNPKYKGEWHPRKIANPNYFVDEHPHNVDKIGGIGIEIWTMKDGILFDNILVTHDDAEATAFASATWVKKNADEQAIANEELTKSTPSFYQQLEQLIGVIVQYVTDPNNLMIVVGTGVVGVVVPILLCWLLPSSGQQKPRDKSKKEKKTEKQMEEKEGTQPESTQPEKSTKT